jgi:putative serine protease PepD
VRRTIWNVFPLSEPASPEDQPRQAVWRRAPGLVLLALIGAVAGGIATVWALRDDDPATAVGCDATTVASQALPSVVTIRVESASSSGSGSGEVIRSDGYILTNDHVVSAAANGGSITVVFSDGASYPAQLAGRDVQTDLAVVKVDREDSFEPIPFGRSSELQIGHPVVALGAPLGLASTVTSGIVSALDRSVNVPADRGQTALIVAAIQTDAAINPGNSGGALVDCSGRLVGIPTAGAVVPTPEGGTSAGNIGIGFAIPSDFARTISDALIATGRVVHGSFGIQVAAVSESGARQAITGTGLYVVATEPGGPSATAGIRAGDVITEIGDEPAVTAQQLQAVTLTERPGDTVNLTFTRDGEEQTVGVTLGSR